MEVWEGEDMGLKVLRLIWIWYWCELDGLVFEKEFEWFDGKFEGKDKVIGGMEKRKEMVLVKE